MRRLVALSAILLLPAAAALGQVCTPVELDTLASSGSLSRPVIYGSTAYVAAGTLGIVAIELNTPDDLVATSSTTTPDPARDILLEYQRGQLVVAESGSGISLWTLAGDGIPQLDERLSVGGTARTLTGSGGEYLVGTQEGSLVTVASAGSLAVEGSVDVGGPVMAIASSTTRAYVAAGSAGLVVVDVSNRAEPTLVDTVDLGGSVSAVVRVRNTLYCSVGGVGIVTLDTSTLSQRGGLPAGGGATGLVVWGNRLYAAVPGSGLLIADASLPETMIQLGSLDLPGATALALSGNLVFVGRGTHGFSSVDVAACISAGVQATTRYIPAAAKAAGAADTYWVTDLAITNFTAAPATASVAYLVKGQSNPTPATVTYVIQPGQQTLLGDVMQQSFGLASGNGALRVVTSHPDVKVTSRTYNAAGAAGTYGQFIPALSEGDAVVPGVPGVLLQLQQNAAFRTNVGLFNISDADVEATIDLYSGSGDLLGTRTQVLRPYEMVQVDRVFTAFSNSVDSGDAVVTVDAGKVLAYASVVDNGSGDPIFIPAQLLVPGSPFGG